TKPARERWQRSPQREGGRPRGTHHKRTRAGHRAGEASHRGCGAYGKREEGMVSVSQRAVGRQMNPREEPDEGIPHVRICAGGRSQGWSLPRLMRHEPMGMVKIFCFGLWALLFGLGLSAEAQKSKIPRVGYISGTGSESNPGTYVEALRQGLRDLGYVDGKNIAIEYRGAEGKLERVPSLVTELVRLEVD